MTEQSIFLTESEISTLTGIKTGKQGSNRNELQIKQLRYMNIPFYINAIGAPVITRSLFSNNSHSNEPKKWQSEVVANTKRA